MHTHRDLKRIFGSEGCSVQDAYHLNNDKSVAGFDIPRSGQPFTVNASGDIANTGNVVERANLTCTKGGMMYVRRT